jgi:hypothetical protein
MVALKHKDALTILVQNFKINRGKKISSKLRKSTCHGSSKAQSKSADAAQRKMRHF